MSEGLNHVVLFGNLGAEPELRSTAGGTSVLKLRMATTERFKDAAGEWKDHTEWHRVTVWGKRAEALAQLLTKGSTICVEGALRTSSYEKNGVTTYSTEIKATNVLLTGSGSGRQTAGDREDTPFLCCLDTRRLARS